MTAKWKQSVWLNEKGDQIKTEHSGKANRQMASRKWVRLDAWKLQNKHEKVGIINKGKKGTHQTNIK